MDRPVLRAFVDELLEDERLAAFAEALPTRARVSEPALPLLLASLHERLNRGLVCALPEDADARDAAEAAAWFLGEDRVALLPSRGVHWASASSRRRTSSASGRGRSTCSLAAGSFAPPRPRSQRGCRRRASGLSRSWSPRGRSRESTCLPRVSRSPATNASSGSRSAVSS